MYTAYARRGFSYPAPGVIGCPNYKQCKACMLCENYNAGSLDCQDRESRKRPIQVCSCTPKRLFNVRRMEEITGRPLYVDPQVDCSFGCVMSTDVTKVKDWNEIADSVAQDHRETLGFRI